MSNHLSATQFASCLAGTAGNPEQQHLLDCRGLSRRTGSLGSAISSFRHAVRDRVESHIAGEPAPIASRSAITAQAPVPKWIVVAAVIVLALGMVPLLTEMPEHRAVPNDSAMDPNALMNAVNLHLLRKVPAPMEPMFVLIPTTANNTIGRNSMKRCNILLVLVTILVSGITAWAQQRSPNPQGQRGGATDPSLFEILRLLEAQQGIRPPRGRQPWPCQ